MDNLFYVMVIIVCIVFSVSGIVDIIRTRRNIRVIEREIEHIDELIEQQRGK